MQCGRHERLRASIKICVSTHPRDIRVGQIFINGYGAGGGIELPFGGMKKSGHGREKGFEAMYEFAALKTIVMRHG